MKITNDTKSEIKKQIVDRIQKLRSLAHDFMNEGDGKSETDCYDQVNRIRQTLYFLGFETKSYAGGIDRVCGLTIELVAHKWANWEKAVTELGLNVNI